MCVLCELSFNVVYRAEYDKLDSLIKKVFDKGIKKGEVDKDLYLSTALKLEQAAQEGLGKKFIEVDYSTPNGKMLENMRKNLHVFSAFKTYHELRAISDLLIDEDSKVRSFTEFKKEAINLHEGIYDGKYLEAEYNNAVLSAQAAAQWMDIEEAKEDLPLLRYSTAKDAKVRPEHAALDGVTLPVDDPFWDMYFPPNDWGCRCDVVQIANGKITDKDKIVAPENKPMFQNNVGKTGIIFPEKHPYYKVSKEEKTAIMAFVEENMPKMPQQSPQQKNKPNPTKRQLLSLEYQQNKDIKQEYVGKKNGVVFIHKDADPTDYERNLQAAKVLADNGYVVLINKHYKKGNPETGKNAEYTIDGVISDLKSPTKLNSIKSTFSNAKDQKITEFVCNLVLEHSYENIKEGIELGFYHNEPINKVVFIKGKKIVIITRKMWINGAYKNAIKNLLKKPVDHTHDFKA